MSTKKLVNEFDKLIEDKNLYSKNQSKTQNKINDDVNALYELVDSELDDVVTEKATNIYIEDSAKYSKNKLDIYGNLKQETRKGYNKLDLSNATILGNDGIINKNEDESFTVNGTVDVTTKIRKNFDEPFILKAGTYTFDFGTASTDFNCELNIASLEKGTYKVIKNLSNNKRYIVVEFNEDFEIYNYNIALRSETTVNNLKISPMIVEGTYTEETLPPYERYGAMPSMEFESTPEVATGVQKIKICEENLLDLSSAKVSGTSSGITVSKNTDDSYNFEGTATNSAVNVWFLGTYQAYMNKRIEETLFKLEPGEYTAKDCIVYILYENGESLAINPALGETLTKTLTKVGHVVAIRAPSAKTEETYNTTICPMIVRGQYDTLEYKKYTERNFLLNLGTLELYKLVDDNESIVAQDRIVRRLIEAKWKWQIERNVKKLILTGDERWAKSSGAEYFYTQNITSQSINAIQNCYILSNYYKYTKQKVDYGIRTGNTQFIQIFDKDYADATSFANKLRELYIAEKPLAVIYPLEMTEYEDCSAELSAQLDELYNLQLERGVNNIFVESENGVEAEMQLTYKQSNSIKYKNEINELKAMILENS